MSGGVLEARDATGLALGCRMTGALVTPELVLTPLPAGVSRSQLGFAAGEARQDSGQRQTGSRPGCWALDCLRQLFCRVGPVPAAPFRITPDSGQGETPGSW